VIWLTGGPGCASELAVFYENGPFTINDDLTLKKNPDSWNNQANVLYID
jgi:cathepsin A (carboxypeptidase C)